MDKVLILGGNGFIGSHIVDILRERKYSVRVFDKKPEQYRNEFEDVEYIYASFDDTLALTEALSDIDIVIHSLSTSVPSSSLSSPIDDINGNLVNTIKFLEIMNRNSVKKILFLSSGGTVYGIPQNIPIPENHSTNPICSYGIVKLAIEKYLLMYEELYDFKTLIFRVSNPYGIRQGHIGVQGFISTALSKAILNEKINIYGDGNIVRDYLYVSDLAEICVNALSFKNIGVFNIGSGKGYSLNEIIIIIENILKKKLDVNRLPARKYDIDKNILSISKLEEIFQWTPTTNIETGIQKQLEWLKSRMKI